MHDRYDIFVFPLANCLYFTYSEACEGNPCGKFKCGKCIPTSVAPDFFKCVCDGQFTGNLCQIGKLSFKIVIIFDNFITQNLVKLMFFIFNYH